MQVLSGRIGTAPPILNPRGYKSMDSMRYGTATLPSGKGPGTNFTGIVEVSVKY
jgi:hypothetical protein